MLTLAPSAAATTPTMIPVPEVIDLESIGTEVGAAGAAALLIIFVWKVGFGLVKKVVRRVHGSI